MATLQKMFERDISKKTGNRLKEDAEKAKSVFRGLGNWDSPEAALENLQKLRELAIAIYDLPVEPDNAPPAQPQTAAPPAPPQPQPTPPQPQAPNQQPQAGVSMSAGPQAPAPSAPSAALAAPQAGPQVQPTPPAPQPPNQQPQAGVSMSAGPQIAQAGTGQPGIQAKGMVEPGNIDIYHRPVVRSADGKSFSTVRTIGVNFGGREYVIPTVSDDGRIMSNDEAIKEFKRTGKHFGVFDSQANAEAFATQLHEQQAALYAAEGKAAIRKGKEPQRPTGRPQMNLMPLPGSARTTAPGSVGAQAKPETPLSDEEAQAQRLLMQRQEEVLREQEAKNKRPANMSDQDWEDLQRLRRKYGR
jgi:hypothetical protein